MKPAVPEAAAQAFTDPVAFAARASGRVLRAYQRDAVRAVAASVRQGAGRSFVVIFARQSGKNEAQAQLFAWLLAALRARPLNIVSVSPTYKPQTLNAIARLEAVLQGNVLTRGAWRRVDGYKVRLGAAQVVFFSGDPSANVVGETAHLLLSIDEAQDLAPARYDKAFAPMAAAHNATRVFWGTSWTADTLLGRELRLAQAAERADGIRRTWVVPADVVGAEVPAYAAFVRAQVAQLGRDHPIIRTQYFCEEIEALGGMFPPGRLALLQGDQPGESEPLPGALYAFCLDAAGQDEALLQGWEEQSADARRDAAALSIVRIDLSTLADLLAPTYRIVQRREWVGRGHLEVFGQVRALAQAWQPQHIVIDATGVGEGLRALLERAFPRRVLPLRFNQALKSEIGWKFLSIIETGRLRDCQRLRPADAEQQRLADQALEQYRACQAEVLPGPAKTLRWGVPPGRRSASGGRIHDDALLADALVTQLETLDWRPGSDPAALDGEDPLRRLPEYQRGEF